MKQQKEPTCQDCKFQRNKPSSCTVDGVAVFVGRKGVVCSLFEWGKK